MKRIVIMLTTVILGLSISAYASDDFCSASPEQIKDNAGVKFSVESLKSLVDYSFKDKEIPEACFIGFAVYEGDTPTIIMHELKAGENECALPLNMSFSGTFEPTKSAIYDFKLSSPNKKREIYFTSLSTPKGFSIATAPTMLIQEENKTRPVLVVVFRYNNLNSDDSKEAEPLPTEKKTSSKQEGVEVRVKETKGYGIFAIYPQI